MSDSHLQRLIRDLEPQISEILRISGTPGLSLAMSHGGSSHTAHFGHRDVLSKAPPEDDTIYYLASLTKAFCSAAIGCLVDEGKLAWNTRVAGILPDFELRSDIISQQATVADILSHRTGLAKATSLWYQRKQHFMMPKHETVNTAVHLDAIGSFRDCFHYSNWGYGLATEIIEKITGKSLDTCLGETIFRPLGLVRTTIGTPKSGDIATPYTVMNDGSPCPIKPPPWSDDFGLAGSTAAKSCIRELVRIYTSMLEAYRHQTRTGLTSTPGSPFKQMATIFAPHIATSNGSKHEESYALG